MATRWWAPPRRSSRATSARVLPVVTTSSTSQIRPGSDRYAVVSSTNANWDDWAHLSKEEYERHKQHLIEDTITAFEKYVPDIRAKLDHVEAGKQLYPTVPYRLSKTPWSGKPAPLLGQHNEEIYCDALGYSRQDLARLAASGVI